MSASWTRLLIYLALAAFGLVPTVQVLANLPPVACAAFSADSPEQWECIEVYAEELELAQQGYPAAKL